MKYSRYEIRSVFLAADKLIHQHPVSPEKVSAILTPFYDCDEVEGLSVEMLKATRSLIFALTADAYREAGNFLDAAAWYQKASSISPGGHAIIYAHMVCKHRLTEYYTDAHQTIEAHTKRWNQKPMIERFFWRVSAWRMWTDKTGREIMFAERKTLQFLRNAARNTA